MYGQLNTAKKTNPNDDDNISGEQTGALWVSVEAVGAAVARASSEAVFTHTLTRTVTVIHCSPCLLTAARYTTNNQSAARSFD